MMCINEKSGPRMRTALYRYQTKIIRVGNGP